MLFVSAASFLFLDESIGWLGWVGAIACLSGVMWLAARGDIRSVASAGLDPAAWFGMAAALGFGVTAVAIRGASSSLEGTALDRAALTVTAILGRQTMVQGAAITASPTSSVRRVFSAWRRALTVAALSLLGSAAWAFAITLENAAKVRTLGQVEIVLAFAIGIVVHGETHHRSEFIASAAAIGGIALIVIA